MRWIGTLVIALALVAWSAPSWAQDDCEAARCAVQAAIDANCVCGVRNGRANHGRYVSCVAHQVKQLADDGTIPINCKGKIKRCAARSTCGKNEGSVVCLYPTDTCTITTDTCNLASSTCTLNPALPCQADSDCTTGACTADPSIACTTDLDCGSRCKIKPSVERCEARGGTVDPARSTCCATCP